MKRLAWLTDIHLNFLRHAGLAAFFASLPESDAFAITGDIGEAHDVADHLRAFAARGPVYFVLGNHDFLPRVDRWCPGGSPEALS